ncbi:MAG: OsmC family protein [Proteobacteria bacterium]|nr:OsmC family protein [Pseudomonadota bacterium]
MSQATSTNRVSGIVNGIDVDALRSTIKAIADDPEKGKLSFNVLTSWAGQTRSESRATRLTLGGEQHPREFVIAADEPEELLGQNSAPNPQEVLMSALNACMLVGYVTGAAMEGVTITRLEIETEGELDLRGFLNIDPQVKPGYDTINYTVRISGDGTPEQFEAIHQSVIRLSPNRFNLAMPITLNASLVVE